MLNEVINTMLPGDDQLMLPSASKINFDNYIAQYSKDQLVFDFCELVSCISREKYQNDFVSLLPEIRLDVINSCKKINIRLFSDFVINLFKAYYSDPNVLLAISSGSVPPFPNGNVIENDDLGILEPVFERGKFFRTID